MNKILIIALLTIVQLPLALGQKVDDFTLNNVTNNQKVSLSDYKDSKGVVVIFTSNVCPYSVYYEGRITQIISEYSKKGISFILINAHNEDKESESDMKNKMNTWGLNVAYLSDKEQKVMNALHASKSPHAFLLKNNGSHFSVFYQGAIDNNPQVASDVKEQYLKINIDNLLSGQPATSNVRPIGCMVKRG
ncbi:redoxin domain-containing protein [Fulvivirga sediminis]|uniref:Redoxin domain-containing protein n=1 Tax=Fulvivirga sediminis TaxID=2803949 RepID=A0A937F8G8_9BACT|nr:redoxin domain-containing protein [Fulvivirga sediminis]MBL3656534.1 redoxin domain-containing protein [Fulvivirga sediminis]